VVAAATGLAPSRLDSGRLRDKPRRVKALSALVVIAVAAALTGCESASTPSKKAGPVPIFDGKTLAGWDGGTPGVWSVQDGALVAGSLQKEVVRNEFLATTRSYTNFVLRLNFKLEGTEGFVNSGIQYRSERIPNHHEMIGYQADIGEGWYGALYDESRRNVLLAKPDPAVVKQALKAGDWNHYEIRAVGQQVTQYLNGYKTIEYTETDPKVMPWGKIAVQVHGGGKAVVRFKDITVEELP
jgi:hypothetical protein